MLSSDMSETIYEDEGELRVYRCVWFSLFYYWCCFFPCNYFYD